MDDIKPVTLHRRALMRALAVVSLAPSARYGVTVRNAAIRLD